MILIMTVDHARIMKIGFQNILLICLGVSSTVHCTFT